MRVCVCVRYGFGLSKVYHDVIGNVFEYIEVTSLSPYTLPAKWERVELHNITVIHKHMLGCYLFLFLFLSRSLPPSLLLSNTLSSTTMAIAV